MINIKETNLFIGGIDDINDIDPKWAIVHATQTIHYKIFGWDRKFNKPDKEHSNYIYYEKDNCLSLNWVDGDAFLYKWSGVETFTNILNFIDKWIKTTNVLVHCDQGQSRAPTIGMLYLAKRSKKIPDASFEDARDEFIKLYPVYSPGGIGKYVEEKWHEIH